jgi:prepilin-type N-terminal cleavage/methylation domain-containing protein
MGKTRNEKGFTLVEIAIVLVIIGLILGAILKGQAMIDNAKIKRVKSDVDGIVAAVFSYQDKYNYLPGDDPKNQFGLGAVGDADGTFDAAEYAMVWRDLIAAGFVSGDSSQTTENLVAKASPYGGRYLFRYTGALGRNHVFVDNIPSETAQSLDEKYDDGTFNTGDIRANADYTGGLRDMLWYVL